MYIIKWSIQQGKSGQVKLFSMIMIINIHDFFGGKHSMYQADWILWRPAESVREFL